MYDAPIMDRKHVAMVLLIAALAFVFLVFGAWKFVAPILWIGWIPPWMEGFLGLSRETWLSIIGALEVVFAILLLVPLRRVRRIGCVLVMAHLVAVLTQTGWNDVFVRDAGLLVASLALFVLLRA